MATLASPTAKAESPVEFVPTHWTQRLAADALDHITGEGGWPLVGNTFRMLADPHGFARRMIETYGPVYKTRAFGGWNVALIGADANELVLFDREKVFSSEQGWGPILDLLFRSEEHTS